MWKINPKLGDVQQPPFHYTHRFCESITWAGRAPLCSMGPGTAPEMMWRQSGWGLQRFHHSQVWALCWDNWRLGSSGSLKQSTCTWSLLVALAPRPWHGGWFDGGTSSEWTSPENRWRLPQHSDPVSEVTQCPSHQPPLSERLYIQRLEPHVLMKRKPKNLWLYWKTFPVSEPFPLDGCLHGDKGHLILDWKQV